MSDAKVKVGILGAGAMGSEHAYVYGEVANVQVAGVFSRNRERAELVARPRGALAVTDPFVLVDDPTIDAIDICLPSANHHQFVIAALERGKHVFCETPFALTLPDARAMIAAARASKRILMVGLLLRSAAHYEHIHRAARSGEFGKLLSVTTYRLGSYLRAGGFDNKEHYSEPSIELMTFDFDFIQWLMGPPTRLSASAVYTERGTPGEIAAVLDYDDACSVTVLASGIMPKSFAFSAGFRVLFEKGAFELNTVFGDGPPSSTFLFYPEDGTPGKLAIAGHNPFEKELRLFIAAVRGEADPSLLDAPRALEALLLSLATQRSLKEHRSVRIDEVDQ
jgi:predicted dehydrogenase